MVDPVAIVSVVATATVAIATPILTARNERTRFERETLERHHENLRDALDAAVQALTHARNAVATLHAALDWPSTQLNVLETGELSLTSLDTPEQIEASKEELQRYQRHTQEAWDQATDAFVKHIGDFDTAVSEMRAEEARLIVRLSNDMLVLVYQNALGKIDLVRTEITWRGTANLKERADRYKDLLDSLGKGLQGSLEAIGVHAQRLLSD